MRNSWLSWPEALVVVAIVVAVALVLGTDHSDTVNNRTTVHAHNYKPVSDTSTVTTTNWTMTSPTTSAVRSRTSSGCRFGFRWAGSERRCAAHKIAFQYGDTMSKIAAELGNPLRWRELCAYLPHRSGYKSFDNVVQLGNGMFDPNDLREGDLVGGCEP